MSKELIIEIKELFLGIMGLIISILFVSAFVGLIVGIISLILEYLMIGIYLTLTVFGLLSFFALVISAYTKYKINKELKNK